MTVRSVTHLNFRGDARDALEFYGAVFDGEIVIITNEDMGIVEEPAEAKQVKWGQVVAPDGFRIMAYDVPASRPWDRGVDPFFLSLRGDGAEEIRSLWERLVEGATVVTPLAPAPWAPLYGMLTDRFGVTWVVDVEVEYPAP